MIEPTTTWRVTEHRTRWKWFLALGAILLVLDMAGISIATLLELTSLLVFGPLLLASSIIQILTALFAETRKERLLHFIAAAMEMALGFLIMVNPPERLVGLIVLVAIFFVAIGLVRLVRSLVTQSRGRAWTLLAGVIVLLLGISVGIGGSAAKLEFVGLCIAVDFLCHGVAWSALALSERKPVQTPVA